MADITGVIEGIKYMRDIAELSLLEAVMNEDDDAAEMVMTMLSKRDQTNLIKYCYKIINMCDPVDRDDNG